MNMRAKNELKDFTPEPIPGDKGWFVYFNL